MRYKIEVREVVTRTIAFVVEAGSPESAAEYLRQEDFSESYHGPIEAVETDDHEHVAFEIISTTAVDEHVCDDECRSFGCKARREEEAMDRHLYGI